MLICFSGGLWLLPNLGCHKEERITHYTVARLPEANVAADKAGTAGPDGAASKEERMLAAMLPHGNQNWFFKVTGPADALGKDQLTSFLALIKSVRFSEGIDARPRWTLPEGWRELPASGMRYATLKFDAAGHSLELAISQLESAGGNSEETILANVNRWRGQLQLPPIALDELPQNTLRVPVNGSTAILVNLVGHAAPNKMGGGAPFAPFAGGGKTPAGDLAAAQARPSADDSPPLTYDTPQGWTPGKTGGFRKAAFEVRDGGKKVEITAIDLPAAGGELLPNVNRWRQQIQLEPTTQEQLDRDIKMINVGPLSGDYIELVGPKTADPHQTILGVIVNTGDKAWFFKLQGDAALAEREKQRFAAFVQSIKIRGTEGTGNNGK